MAQRPGSFPGLRAGCATREYFLRGTEPPPQDCERALIPRIIDWGAGVGRDAGKELIRLIGRELRALRGRR